MRRGIWLAARTLEGGGQLYWMRGTEYGGGGLDRTHQEGRERERERIPWSCPEPYNPIALHGSPDKDFESLSESCIAA